MATNRFVKHNKFKIIKGGAGVMEAVIHNSVITTNSAEIKRIPKTETEQLIQACNAFAKKHNITHEDIQSTIESVRKRLNACGR